MRNWTITRYNLIQKLLQIHRGAHLATLSSICLARATTIKKGYFLKNMTKKPKNKTKRNENAVSNVNNIDLLLNISWKVNNQARFVGKLTWVLNSHGSILKYKIRTCNFGLRVYNWVCQRPHSTNPFREKFRIEPILSQPIFKKFNLSIGALTQVAFCLRCNR